MLSASFFVLSDENNTLYKYRAFVKSSYLILVAEKAEHLPKPVHPESHQ